MLDPRPDWGGQWVAMTNPLDSYSPMYGIARGNRREVSNRVLLRRMEKRGQIDLPPPAGKIQQRKLTEVVGLPEGTHTRSGRDIKYLHDLEVVPVTARQKREHAQRVSLMESSHYLGRGPLCGAKIRFLGERKKPGGLN